MRCSKKQQIFLRENNSFYFILTQEHFSRSDAGHRYILSGITPGIILLSLGLDLLF